MSKFTSVIGKVTTNPYLEDETREKLLDALMELYRAALELALARRRFRKLGWSQITKKEVKHAKSKI